MGFVAIGEPFLVSIRPTHYGLTWKQDGSSTSVRGLSFGDVISDREERLIG